MEADLGHIRRATTLDILRMVELSEKKRVEYEKYQPVFWKKAVDSRERQIPFFQDQILRPNVIALVHEEGEKVNGFVIAVLVGSPPVYDPGGLTCLIDDFVVENPERWKDIGARLLAEIKRQVCEKGVVQSVVFCGHLDSSKREMLSELDYSISTDVYVKPI